MLPGIDLIRLFFKRTINKKNPLKPDKDHLHMLSYYKILSRYGKNKADFLNAIFINIVYLILVIPGIFLLESPMLSRCWFFILLVIYVLIYFRLYRFTKN